MIAKLHFAFTVPPLACWCTGLLQRARSLNIAPDDVVHGRPFGMAGTSRDRVIVGRRLTLGVDHALV
jgi:hypothetical protein